MNPFTYTPTDARAAGVAYANASAKAAHTSAQSAKPEEERLPYTVTDEEYAHAALDRVADSYCAQQLDAALKANRQLLADAILFLTDDQKAQMKAQIEAAKQSA